jgi:hypothetical protein
MELRFHRVRYQLMTARRTGLEVAFAKILALLRV